MNQKSKKTQWHSSYEEHNYGELFYALIRVYQPKIVVELGTKAGYSAYHMARGLRDNGRGTIDCYDLWEQYVEHYGLDYLSKAVAEKNLEPFKDIVKLELRDAVGVDKKYTNVDILHVDLDNDGTILEIIIPAWIEKVGQIIIIEGGSLKRDQVAASTDHKKLAVGKWLNDLNKNKTNLLKEVPANPADQSGQFVIVGGKKDYKEKPIAPWLKSFRARRNDFEYFTIEPFPSVTILRKIR